VKLAISNRAIVAVASLFCFGHLSVHWLTFIRFTLLYDSHTHIHTHTHILTALFPGLLRWAGTRKVKPIWVLLKQKTVSGSGISWAICKSAPCSRQIAVPAPRHSVFYRPDALRAIQPAASKHWRLIYRLYDSCNVSFDFYLFLLINFVDERYWKPYDCLLETQWLWQIKLVVLLWCDL